MYRVAILSILITLFACPARAEPTPDTWLNGSDQAISDLAETRFAPLTQGESPGFAVGVMYEDELIYAAGFGMADLEHQTPITAQSRFYIASISKQFTAAIAFQLALEGRLDLHAPITDYLSGLPEAYHDIRVIDTLHHSGGIREYTSLLLMRGDDWSVQDRMSNSDALELIRRQQDLDFQPGTQFRYSSSGYVLLTAILETLEGDSLRAIAERRIFEPLNMQSTHFDDDHGEIIPDRVRSYRPQLPSGRGEWRQWHKHFDVVGDGGIVTTLADMNRWNGELSTGELFGEAWRVLMHQTGGLNDGRELDYAGGLWMQEFEGLELISHGGGMGGFIADYLRFPELDLAILVMANRNDAAAFQAYDFARDIISTLVRASEGSPGPTPSNPQIIGQPDPAFVPADWVGAYFIESRNNRRYLRMGEDGALDLHGGGDEFLADLIPLGGYSFALSSGAAVLELSEENGLKRFHLTAETYAYEATAYDDSPPTSLASIRPIVGLYCSDELETSYRFRIEESRLLMRVQHGSETEIWPRPTLPNLTWNGQDRVWIGIAMIKFRRTVDGGVSGFGMGDGRVSNVEFTRCDTP